MLTLPLADGTYARLQLWACPLPCGEFVQCQGTFQVGDPPTTVEGLLAKTRQERQAGVPVAHYARDEVRQQRRGGRR